MYLTSNDEGDYWTDTPLMGSADDEADLSRALTVQKIGGVEPLDSQFGVLEPLTVPAALCDVLFGQSELIDGSATPTLHTYAILDAAKVPCLPEMLDASGLDHACLFNGQAAEELRNVAPYLVMLEEEHVFTRNLFTKGEAGWQMWDKEPGVFVRSPAALDALRKHLRKFTRVQDEHGAWFYFRFWDNVTWWDMSRKSPWLSHLCSDPVSWLVIRTRNFAHRISKEKNAPEPTGRLVLTRDWKRNIALAHGAKYAQEVLSRDHRDLHRTLTPNLRGEWSWRMSQAFHAHDLRRIWSQECYISLALVLGSHFDTDVTYPGVQDILKQDRPCFARMLDLREECFRIIRDVCGHSYQHYARALGRFAALDEPQVARIVTCENPLGVILDFFPERARLLSMDRQKLLTDRCNAKAQAAFAPEDQRGGAVLLFAHAFLLGEGSLEDPLHDYLRSILRSDHPDKVQRLLRYGQKRARAQLRLIRKTQG